MRERRSGTGGVLEWDLEWIRVRILLCEVASGLRSQGYYGGVGRYPSSVAVLPAFVALATSAE